MKRLLLCCAAVAALGAADYDVLTVHGPDRLVLDYRGLPVSLQLANLDIPQPMADQCRARLDALVAGKSVSIIHKETFGVDQLGTARVHLKRGSSHVNAILIAEGLARFAAGTEANKAYDMILQRAQAKAKKASKGLWADGALATSNAPAAPPAKTASTPAPAPAATTSRRVTRGPYAAELNGRYYYASDAKELANVKRQRLIYYRSKAEAKKAGKRPAPKRAARPAERTVAAASSAFERGQQLYAEAIAAGNTSKRDDLYGEAFSHLTVAMQIYSGLLDQDKGNADLQERLRKTMQLRYGAMKQRRF